MRKASKILTLILLVVFTVSVFAGCSLVGRNVAKYRGSDALQVGSQVISVGKLLDTFNSYYNNYYYYISQGYLDGSQLLDMVMSSLVQQYMQIDDYVSDESNRVKDVTELQKTVKNGEFITKEQFAYAVKYVNYLAFNAFDQYTDQNISAKLELEAEETPDTSRDFTEYDELTGMDGKPVSSYAQYTLEQNFVSEEANEYFEENYPFLQDKVTGEIIFGSYVYDLSNADQKAKAEERVKEYNDRRAEDEEGELTLDEYIEILKDTSNQYVETVQNNYGISLDEFLKGQLEDMVNSCILALWNYRNYKDIEADKDALNKTLTEKYNALKRAQTSDFGINGNFDSFITGLSSSSVLYNVPAEEADNYVFVKNILIPFTDFQTSQLTALQNQLGSNESEKYLAKRSEFASQIVAQYFDSDKYTETDEGKAFEDKYFSKDKWFVDKKEKDEDDSLWKAKTNVFATDAEGKLIINPDGVLGQFFNADGSLGTVEGMEPAEVIVELMKRFNTDTAQHTAAFDYVVYVGDDWEDYNHSWVKEFYTAVNEDLVPHDGSAGKQYTLCISTYGVHIIYLTGKVSQSDKLFSGFQFDSRLDTSTQSYQLFTAYFNSVMNRNSEDALKALREAGASSENIKKLPGFNKFCKDNDFDFDFAAFIEELKEAE